MGGFKLKGFKKMRGKLRGKKKKCNHCEWILKVDLYVHKCNHCEWILKVELIVIIANEH